MDTSPLHNVLGPVCRFAAILCGWGLLVLSVLTCVEIVGRKLFGFTLHGIDEIGGYALAVSTAFGFALALVRRAHTRVDLLLVSLPPKVQAVLNAAAAVALAAFAAFMAERGFAVLGESLEFRSVSNSPLQVPMWLPQGLWFAGLLLFAAVAAALAVDAVRRLLRGEVRAMNALYGPPTVLEEIEEELGTDLSDLNRRAAE